jgi:DNA-binding transcriptional ArsR family regulator
VIEAVEIPYAHRSRMRMVEGMKQAEEDQRRRILALLNEAGGSANVHDLAAEIGTSAITIRQRLRDLREAGHEIAVQDDAMLEIGAALLRMNERR